jgi:hypothetical protein
MASVYPWNFILLLYSVYQITSRRGPRFLPTLAITWPQDSLGEEYNVTAAAQVHGGVS